MVILNLFVMKLINYVYSDISLIFFIWRCDMNNIVFNELWLNWIKIVCF